ncbi:uncharacterized protein M6B38_282320 [Iris pallida]|uniref:Erythronate-4-phosphate dehydrogenase family protein n=1 Tax=Iris pallida TaxID=29817 RepID=A0AAX6I1E2_IRIPA|nr:uncharacterized protein M6B38_282320 [Iris pallida]
MGRSYDPMADDAPASPTAGRHIIMHPLYLPKLPPWFDLRVFYIRIGNCGVFTGAAGGGSVPCRLTVSHFPLSPDTVLEVNGRRSGIHSDCAASSVLRRDRVDKDSEEVTFVSTDTVRMTGSVRFEVFDGEEPLLVGVLENVENKKWSMRCKPASLLKGKQVAGPEAAPSPVIEVYVAGCFAGSPIILTKTLQLSSRKKSQKKLALDSIPEYDPTEAKKEVSSGDAMQVSDYDDYKTERDVGIDYNSIYSRSEYIEGEEDGELSWFNAGVRVGVGIGLGICLGVGIGVGVLVRTYQATTRNFKRRLI